MVGEEEEEEEEEEEKKMEEEEKRVVRTKKLDNIVVAKTAPLASGEKLRRR